MQLELAFLSWREKGTSQRMVATYIEAQRRDLMAVWDPFVLNYSPLGFSNSLGVTRIAISKEGRTEAMELV